MADDTHFRDGQQIETGPMRVSPAEASYKSQKELPLQTDQAKKKGTNANRDRKKVIKKTQEMNKYVPHHPHAEIRRSLTFIPQQPSRRLGR